MRHGRPPTWLDRVGLPISLGRESARCPVGKRSGSRWRAPSCSSQACCCSTSARRPRQQNSHRGAVGATHRHLDSFPGCVVLVTHDALDARARRPHRRDRARARRAGGDAARRRPTSTNRLRGAPRRRSTSPRTATVDGVVVESGSVVATAPDAAVTAGQSAMVAFGDGGSAASIPTRGKSRATSGPQRLSAWSAPCRGPDRAGGRHPLRRRRDIGRCGGARARSRTDGLGGRQSHGGHRVSRVARVPRSRTRPLRCAKPSTTQGGERDQ